MIFMEQKKKYFIFDILRNPFQLNYFDIFECVFISTRGGGVR